MGRKAPHNTVIPLCKFHHDEFHRLGKKPWEVKYGGQGQCFDDLADTAWMGYCGEPSR